MSVFGDVGIAAAERLERSLGPSVGLRAYRKLLADDDPAIRSAAVLAVLRCARATHDDAAVDAAAHCWQSLRTGAPRGMVPIVASLVAERRERWAFVLAEAEAKRRRDGRGHYLLARVLLAFGRTEDALDTFDRAGREGDAHLGATAAVMRLRFGNLGEAQAVALARDVDVEAASPVQRAWIADALLRSPSHFVRARGLSLLADLADAAAPLGPWAIDRVARHADAAGVRMTWVEADRITVAIAKHPDDHARSAAMAALEALRRLAGTESADSHRSLLRSWPDGDRYLELVEALQQGLDVQPEALDLETRHPLHVATRALSVIAALRRSEVGVAAAHLRALDAMRGRMPAPVWTAWLHAAEERDPTVRALATLAIRRALAHPFSPPPRGYLSLEPALRRGGAPDEVLDVLRRATARGEPGARELLVRELVAKGWQAHGGGDRHVAAAWLREAKLLA